MIFALGWGRGSIITLEFRFYYEKRAGIFPVMPNPQGRHYEEAIYRADYDSTVFHYACSIGQLTLTEGRGSPKTA